MTKERGKGGTKRRGRIQWTARQGEIAGGRMKGFKVLNREFIGLDKNETRLMLLVLRVKRFSFSSTRVCVLCLFFAVAHAFECKQIRICLVQPQPVKLHGFGVYSAPI